LTAGGSLVQRKDLSRVTSITCSNPLERRTFKRTHLLVIRREATPKIYRLDQFSSGLDVVVTDSFDQRVTDKTQIWWKSVMDTKGKGYSTMLRVWPLRRPHSP
jgi:hypothetical protein